MTAAVRNGSNGVQERVQGAARGVLATVHSYANDIASEGKVYLDKTISPEQRSDIWENLQAFVLANPKLSAFIGVNLLLSGFPLGVFILFATTVTVSSLVTGLLLGLIGAVLFIAFAVGTALCILLPTIFLTTTCALFLFAGGLIGYYILNWASGGLGSQEGNSDAFGEKLKALASGVSSDLEGKDKTQKSIDAFIHNTPESQSANLSSVRPNGNAENVTQNGNKADGLDGAHKNQLVVTSTA